MIRRALNEILLMLELPADDSLTGHSALKALFKMLLNMFDLKTLGPITGCPIILSPHLNF